MATGHARVSARPYPALPGVPNRGGHDDSAAAVEISVDQCVACRGMVDNGSVTTLPRKPKRDVTLAAATDVARAALVESVTESAVGEHVGAVAEGERMVTHYFDCRLAAYAGWRWAVTLSRAPRQKAATVDEVHLLPGADALVAPEWVPYRDRVTKDDLGPGDVNPRPSVDPRLVPAHLVGAEALDERTAREQREVVRELGLGRKLVLSIEGRDDAAERWYAGAGGPDAPIAKAAPARCAGCGFLVRVAGPLSQAFGLCANGASPSDGHVVSLDHGCGAHSDLVEPPSRQPGGAGAPPVLDTVTWDTWADADLEVIAR